MASFILDPPYFLQMPCLKSSVPIDCCTWREIELFKLKTYNLQWLHHFTCFRIIHFWDSLGEYLYILEIFSVRGHFKSLCMPYPHSSRSLAETEPSWNGRGGNHMKPNHYGQELAGFRVLCVLNCYALLYRRHASRSHAEGGWQSCVIEADKASGGWPSRALLGIIKSWWTVDRRYCCLACTGRRHDGWPH